MLQRYLLFFLIMLLLATCDKRQQAAEYEFVKDDDTITVILERGETNYLKCYVNDSLMHIRPLPYPVYQFLKGDVNSDGTDDIAVGVIKTTRYDSVVRKRLFLFQIQNNALAPLWLGSGLGHPIEDFTLLKTESTTVVRAICYETDGTFLVAEYQWLGFGLNFKRYLVRNVKLEVAKQTMMR